MFEYFSRLRAIPPPGTSSSSKIRSTGSAADLSSNMSRQQWSVEVPSTSRPPSHPSGGRGNVRRSHDPLSSPTLGSYGVRTLYEAFRRGRDINPLGPCLGYRATR